MRHDLFSDTWVCTDALGRELPGYRECGPPRPGRHVGIFYFICNTYAGPEPPRAVTKLLAANPNDPGFEPGFPHFWGEPEAGYYRSTDRWVIRRHAYLLADAGVDTLIFDVTNDVTFPETYTAVCDVFRQVREEGEPAPAVCFLASERSIELLWGELYSRGLYEDLWFRWKGKPLLLFGQWEKRGDMNLVRLPGRLEDFFTIRRSWAWDSLPWYVDGGRHCWPWVAHTPQPVGWDVPGAAEQVPVAIAEHPLSAIGRSYHAGRQPPSDEYDVTPYTAQGPYFAEQWRRALEVDPEFIFVTGWNEWLAGGQLCTDPSQKALMAQWDFFPGAQLSRAGRPLKAGDVYFVDQYNQEFSRDAEPMRGGHTDNYYYQMVAGIRRFKGVRPPPAASTPATIDVSGDFSQWDGVEPEYRDHLYETLGRDELAWGGGGRYINTSGRNELTLLKVARDSRCLYFYARTREPLTSPRGDNWMLLFLDTDRRTKDRWEGFDFLVNWPVVDGNRTAVKRNAGGWSWQEVGLAPYRAAGRELMIAIPREMLGLEGEPLAFDFHWADNIPCSGSIEDFFHWGDSAPPRRANYRFAPA